MNEKRRTRLGFWNNKYAASHTPWDLGEVSAPVRRLVEAHFPPEARVLVPGCGRGYEVIWLERLGYQVTAVDFAEEPIRYLREQAERHGVRPEIMQEDIFLLPIHFNGSFDVILEQTCFCAIDPSLYGEYERMAHRMLKPGGRLLGVFMEVKGMDGPPYDTPLELVRAQFPANRWRFGWSEPLPRNPKRPGPEFLAAFTRLGQDE
jgi:SAM-dependent methyltransferase